MLCTPLAFAWALWRQHRAGLLVVLGFLLLAGTLSAVLPARCSARVAEGVFGALAMPLVCLAVYLLVVFSYGSEAALGGRESCFQAGLFRLPVRTGALAGWPLAYGAAAAFLLWLVVAGLILRPWLRLWGEEVPLWWPAVLAVADLAWLQALLWLPFGLRGLRVFLVVILIPGLLALAEYAVTAGVSEGFLTGLFAGFAVLGWTTAYVGVRHGRPGAVPDWEGIYRLLLQLADRLPRRRQSFASAARAQVWFDWRRTGSSLPIMTGLLLPFTLVFLVFGENDVIPPAQTLLSALAVPVIMAGLAGITGGVPTGTRDWQGMPPYAATLPMTTAGLVAAKLRAAARSTLATWALMALALPLAVVLTGNLDEVAGWWRQALHAHHPVKIAAGVVAAVTLLVVGTWGRLVNGLFLSLTGRIWLITCGLFAGVAAFAALWILGAWLYRDPEARGSLRTVWPWLLGLLILCRLLAAGWALRRGLHAGLLDLRTIRRWLTAWLLFGAALFGLLAWVVPAELVPWYYSAFAVLLVLPMARLAASPLVLAWNRHR